MWAKGEASAENSVYAVLENPDGSVLLGTDAGLMRIEESRIVPVEQDEFSVDRPVYFLVRDAAGRLWCGTDTGVVVWDGTSARVLTTADGLAGYEANRAAAAVDDEGRVWIGTNSGLSIYRPKWEFAEPVPPRVRIEAVRVDEIEHPVDGDLELGHLDNHVTFDVSILSFVDENRITVRHRLEGLETRWESERAKLPVEFHYPRLPPGRYRLHVQATSAEGAAGDVVVSPWISVANPFWLRPPFFLLMAALLAAVLYIAHRFLAQHRYARELESEVGRRVIQVHQAQEELARAERLSSLAVFASGLAHDFNNLLMIMLGNLSLLRMRIEGSSIDSAPLEKIADAVSRATELTSQFLTFARGGAPVCKVLDVGVIARESASLVLAGTNVECRPEFPADLRCAEVDAGQIAQVFNNLLLNAVQAMPDGGTIRFSADNVDEAPAKLPGDYVAFSITDEGAGIDAESRKRIFDPFFSTKEQGRGLGLSSAYSIVNRHGGILTLDTATGPGSTFRVYLPASNERPVIEIEEPAVARLRRGRVLIMDDDDAVRSTLCAMLEAVGFVVDATHEGGAAIDCYAESLRDGKSIHLVILDLTVRGGLGGRETMRRLLAVDPDVRAIVASGYSDDPVMANHRDHGFRAAIPKPFTRSELLAVVDEVLESHDVGSPTSPRV